MKSQQFLHFSNQLQTLRIHLRSKILWNNFDSDLKFCSRKCTSACCYQHPNELQNLIRNHRDFEKKVKIASENVFTWISMFSVRTELKICSSLDVGKSTNLWKSKLKIWKFNQCPSLYNNWIKLTQNSLIKIDKARLQNFHESFSI